VVKRGQTGWRAVTSSCLCKYGEGAGFPSQVESLEDGVDDAIHAFYVHKTNHGTSPASHGDWSPLAGPLGFLRSHAPLEFQADSLLALLALLARLIQRLSFLRSQASTVFLGSMASWSICSSRIFPSLPIRKLMRRAALYLST